jgi:hypothetical protein
MTPGIKNEMAVENLKRYSEPKNNQADTGPTLRKA